MDDAGSLLNHSRAAPLRVMRKELHRISSGGCWRPNVVLNVFRWSSGSLKGSSWGRRNLKGTGHFWTTTVNGESVFLTILSKLWSVFSLMAFLNSSIFFLISLRRSEFASSGVLVHLPLLSTLSSLLTSVWFFSYCSRCLISWFCLVSSSTMAASNWTCTASAVGSWLVVDSIWNVKLDGAVLYNDVSKSNRFPQMASNWWCPDRQSNVIVQNGVILEDPDLESKKQKCGAPVWCLPQSLQCQSQKNQHR